MQVNLVQNSNNKIANKLNFSGLSKVIGADTLSAFLKKTQHLADVDIFQRTYEKGKLKLKPMKAALVKCQLSQKGGAKDSKIFYSLFMPGYEKLGTLAEVDAAELGLAEVKYKNLRNAMLQKGTKLELDSAKALQKNYKDGLKILHLISYEADRFKGIGTALVDAIVQNSDEMGVGGRVFLYAQNLFPPEYLKPNAHSSAIARKKVPTRFYYNYGFRANREANMAIEQNPDAIDKLTMYLPQSTIAQILTRYKA